MSWQIFYHQRHATSMIFFGSGAALRSKRRPEAINFARFKTLRFSSLFIPKVQAIKLFITISSLTISSINHIKNTCVLNFFCSADKK